MSVTASLFSAIENILQWLDDALLHADNEEELLKSLRSFFDMRKIWVDAKKTNFFLREAPFCGCIIDQNGVRYC